jgi:phosphoenolpyruvate carboxykinase (ATP)
MPKRNILPLAASANRDEYGQTTLFLGGLLSGRTALSVGTGTSYIGDAHHGWSQEGIFNLVGGMYPRINNLEDENLLKAIKFGAVVENADFYKNTRLINFKGTQKSKNSRVCIPNSYIPNAHDPAIGGHPSHIIFLVNDPSGLLPAAAKLTPEQAAYHYLSGYSPVVGRQNEFSACFAEPFLAYNPTRYMKMFYENI